MRYMVVIERGESSWGAHVPDLPGCVAVGEMRDEVIDLIRQAIALHIEGLKREGLPVPKPISTTAPRSSSQTLARTSRFGLRPITLSWNRGSTSSW